MIQRDEFTGWQRQHFLKSVHQSRKLQDSFDWGFKTLTSRQFKEIGWQVGKDTGAQAFLASLDVDPVVGRQIDCTSYYENESEEFKRKGIELSPELWLVKLLVGSIDPSYDEQVLSKLLFPLSKILCKPYSKTLFKTLFKTPFKTLFKTLIKP